MWAKDRFACEKEQLAHGHSFVKSKGSDLLVFCEQKRDSLVKKSKSLPLLFCHEQRERIAHGHSFFKSEESEGHSLKMRVEQRATGVIRSWYKKGENCQKHWKIHFFRANQWFFESHLLELQANHWPRSILNKLRVIFSLLLFCHEWPEQSLTVALLFRERREICSWMLFFTKGTWAHRSQLLNKMSDFYRTREERKSEFPTLFMVFHNVNFQYNKTGFIKGSYSPKKSPLVIRLLYLKFIICLWILPHRIHGIVH